MGCAVWEVDPDRLDAVFVSLRSTSSTGGANVNGIWQYSANMVAIILITMSLNRSATPPV